MAEMTNIPLIFLAFANDRDDNVGYLRNLPDKARRLRDALKPAEQAGLCEVVVRSNSTAEDTSNLHAPAVQCQGMNPIVRPLRRRGKRIGFDRHLAGPCVN